MVELFIVPDVKVFDNFHESLDVSHAKEFFDKGHCVERLELMNVFARSNEDNRRLSGGDGREGATALGVAVQLGDDDGADVHLLLKGLSLRLASLANRGVHDEDNVVRTDSVGDRQHFFEQGFFLHVTSGRVHNNDLHPLLFEQFHT